MGFESNHKNRDAELPKHRQLIKEAIEQDLLNDKQVIAVFYGGSIGNGNTDNYSDIDLRIVVKDEAYEHYRQQKRERASEWGKVLFYEDVAYTNYSVAHFDCFVKVDTFYYRKKDLQPSVWLKNIEIVRDSSGLLEEILEKSMVLSYEFTAEDVEFWRTKFFAYLHEAYRRVMRNEIYYALRCLDNLRFSIVTAWYMEAGIQPNAFVDWARVEGERSPLQPWQLTLLKRWSSNRETSEIMNVIHNMVPEFKRLHRSLCNQVGIEASNWVEEVLNKVL